MLKLTRFALLGTAALLSAVACNKEVETEKVPDNPTYNPSSKEVTTQFVLNIANGQGATTKMTAADVQADGSFRGIDEVHLLTYDLDYNGVAPGFLYDVTDESSKATRDYDLGQALSANEISASQSSSVLEISLPLETNAILFYGRAPRTKTRDEHGSVTASGTAIRSSLSSVSFKLDNRLEDFTAFQQYGNLMSKILTGIMMGGRTNETAARSYNVVRDNTYAFWWPVDDASKNFAVKDGDGNYFTASTVPERPGYTYYHGEKTWRSYGIDYAKNQNDTHEDDVNLFTLEEMMGEAYYRITTLRQDPNNATKTELRSASSASVRRLAADLYQILSKVRGADANNYRDYIAQLVAKDVIFRASHYFEPSGNDLVWKEFNAIKQNTEQYIKDAVWDTDFNKVTEDFFYSQADNRPGFPLNLGLPGGSALMKFTTKAYGDLTVDEVSYLEAVPAYGIGGTALSVQNYRYPAELMYWTNSSIRTNDNAVEKNAYPQTVATWDVAEWSGWTSNGTVKSTTRSVAVTKEINYGTALMATKVKYGANTIHDNNKGIHPAENNNAIDVSTGNNFQVVGIMIGGVSDNVGWNFLSKDNEFNKMLYDKLIDSEKFYIPVAGTEMTTPKYTMTWDNYNETLGVNEQSKVYVALELINNTGKDIWGELNLIRAGGTFYLVGALDPTNATAQASLPKKNNVVDLSRTNFNYPPYDADGKTISAPRVFMQDYVTTVNFVFGDESLKHAYVTMPDLRASNVSLGLSVDLTWEPGLTFDNVILGEDSNN